MNFSPFVCIEHSCYETLQWSKEHLTQAGLRPVQTFDLHTARLSLHDCPCPNHGTDDCDCQMVILLVYGNSGTPETLVLHGNGEKTWLSISDTFDSDATGSLTELIKTTLIMQEPLSAVIHK